MFFPGRNPLNGALRVKISAGAVKQGLCQIRILAGKVDFPANANQTGWQVAFHYRVRAFHLRWVKLSSYAGMTLNAHRAMQPMCIRSAALS
jgi:hypothetical protein